MNGAAVQLAFDVYRDLEERVLKDVPRYSPNDRPGQSIIKTALAERDTELLRKIAAERTGLTDQQRRGLLFVADLLDCAAGNRRKRE